MIGSKDQEEIFKLYENFRGMELTQPSDNLARFQHPNYSPESSSESSPGLSTTGTWRGINSPAKPDRLTPEQEEGESNFKFKDQQGNLYTFLRTKGDLFVLRSDKLGIILEIPKDKIPSLFEEV